MRVLAAMRFAVIAPVRVLLFAACLLGLPTLLGLPSTKAQAQMASLVADSVTVSGGSDLVATGNIVVIFQGVRLTATQVIYHADRGVTGGVTGGVAGGATGGATGGGHLTITGPITLTEGSDTVILADAAQLSADLRNGILQSARLVLNQQLQIAAQEIARVDGRYTEMRQVVASSCQVCANRPVPLWAIRASQVIHDQQEHQLYFYNAQLRVMDIPVFYLPRMRLPDPTVTRATGFLPPRIRSSSYMGAGLRLPYFITMGDHADLLLAPILTQNTKTVDARYRQALRFGALEFTGAVSQDNAMPGTARYYLFGNGQFRLPGDFTLDFRLEQVSDIAYLSDFGFAGGASTHNDAGANLRNEIALSRTRRDQYFFANIGTWQTLRASEVPIADQLPSAQAGLFFEQRWHPGQLGEIAVAFSGDVYARRSTLDALGRDQGRLGLNLSWRRDWIFSGGLIASAEAALAGDYYQTRQDAGFAQQTWRRTQAAAIRLAWPLTRHYDTGASDIIEPVVQLAWAGQTGADAANEDSLFVEFDAANLFDLSRFPGSDATELGARANLGLSWTRHNPDGLSFTLAGGRVFRAADQGQFSQASGLDGVRSDWLLAGQVQLGTQLFAQGRALIADDFSLTQAETLATWQGRRLTLAAGQVWVIADASEGRPDPIHEWTMDGLYRFSDNWATGLNTHYDAAARAATKADLTIEFRNECITLDLSLSRRFTSSGSIAQGTDIGFGVELTGFGSGAGARARECRG